VTIKSLRVLLPLQQECLPGQAQPAWSFLSTLIVENFFSIIRSKHRYPSLHLYAITYHSAFNHLVYRLSFNSGCKQGSTAFGKGALICLFVCAFTYVNFPGLRQCSGY
jgi:hypothetical protein